MYILRKKISSGSKFEKIVGYSRAVVDGDWIFVSGTTGYDYKNHTISDDIVEQTEQCISNIKPANTTVVTGFVDDQIKIEIEVTARRF